MPRTCRPHTRSVRPSHADISAISVSSTPSPSRSGWKPCTARTRVMVQAVSPPIGPDKGQACRSRVWDPDETRRSTACSSRADCWFTACIWSRSAVGRSVLGPVPS